MADSLVTFLTPRWTELNKSTVHKSPQDRHDLCIPEISIIIIFCYVFGHERPNNRVISIRLLSHHLTEEMSQCQEYQDVSQLELSIPHQSQSEQYKNKNVSISFVANPRFNRDQFEYQSPSTTTWISISWYNRPSRWYLVISGMCAISDRLTNCSLILWGDMICTEQRQRERAAIMQSSVLKQYCCTCAVTIPGEGEGYWGR